MNSGYEAQEKNLLLKKKKAPFWFLKYSLNNWTKQCPKWNIPIPKSFPTVDLYNELCLIDWYPVFHSGAQSAIDSIPDPPPQITLWCRLGCMRGTILKRISVGQNSNRLEGRLEPGSLQCQSNTLTTKLHLLLLWICCDNNAQNQDNQGFPLHLIYIWK